jgi:predicted RNase H-like nuclease
MIRAWQETHKPTATIVMLDQPTIVRNRTGQRPVENLAASSVSLRFGGIQPANTTRAAMFGADAPVWGFLAAFGGAADPMKRLSGTRVIETYPVLALIAMDWLLPHARPTSRLPKYNPERSGTYLAADWRHVCTRLATAFTGHGLTTLAAWSAEAGRKKTPRKADQDLLDACICLLVALHLAEARKCLMTGQVESGYIVVPHGQQLQDELLARCTATGRPPAKWVRTFALAR